MLQSIRTNTLSGADPVSKPEFQKEAVIATDAAGFERKAHYGSGRQPIDDIEDAGWGAAFCAGNALKYVRRHAAKNGADDLEKFRWYYQRLAVSAEAGTPAFYVLQQLNTLLTAEELRFVQMVKA